MNTWNVINDCVVQVVSTPGFEPGNFGSNPNTIFNNLHIYMLKNLATYNNYLPLINGVIITDLLGVLLSNMGILKSNVLKKWYIQYNLSAIISDVTIILLVLIITKTIYFYIFEEFSLLKFIMIAVSIQIIHDILFYFLFSNIPRGVNKMMDTFKDYANEVSYKAIIADSVMIILACLISAYLVDISINTNVIILVVSLYLMPYLLYN